MIIGCLGLFGLAAFTAERRTKEIGIRKVLGARTRDIVQLLVWQFSRPVIIANVIAWPVAWWMMRDWLNGFDQRIALGRGRSCSRRRSRSAIAVVTVVGHAVRIARANPIHALGTSRWESVLRRSDERRTMDEVEARAGIEPACKDLQSSA